MKAKLAAIICVCFFVACKTPTEPQYPMLGSMRVIADEPYEIVGGGRWFNSRDTGTWYDLFFSYRVDNTESAVAKNIAYKVEIGFFENGHFVPGDGKLFFDGGDSVLIGSVNILGRTDDILDISRTFGVGRKNNDWTHPYGFRLTLSDTSINASLSIEDMFLDGLSEGSGANNRYHGVVLTTEASPDPIGIFDPPDWDWKSNDSSKIRFEPANPNPASNSTTLHIALMSDTVTLVYSLHKTPNTIVFSDTISNFHSGNYALTVPNTGIKPGMYRFIFSEKYYYQNRPLYQLVGGGGIIFSP